MNSVTLVLKPNQIQEMQFFYSQQLLEPVPYSIFRAKDKQVTITAYQSGKVLFQGKQAQEVASLWQEKFDSHHPHSQKQVKPTENLNKLDRLNIVGSDEVGNGSYFGALTVCSVYLSTQQIPRMIDLGVKDSKLLTDSRIISLATQIKQEIKYSLTICNPIDYNQLIGPYNAVSLKVHLHNKTINQLLKQLNSQELSSLDGILIDQFTNPNNYYKYLASEINPIQKQLIFHQRAESEHLSVACASIIARAAFLQSLNDLGKDYQVSLPSGAGHQVDQIAKDLVKQFGPTILENTAKLHFKNTTKILGSLPS